MKLMKFDCFTDTTAFIRLCEYLAEWRQLTPVFFQPEQSEGSFDWYLVTPQYQAHACLWNETWDAAEAVVKRIEQFLPVIQVTGVSGWAVDDENGEDGEDGE